MRQAYIVIPSDCKGKRTEVYSCETIEEAIAMGQSLYKAMDVGSVECYHVGLNKGDPVSYVGGYMFYLHK